MNQEPMHLTIWLNYKTIPIIVCADISQSKSIAILSNPPDKIPIEHQTVKSIAVKSHALAIPSAEQARESSGHGVVKSNRLSQEVLELPAWWSGSFASVVGSAAAGCQPSYSKERSHKPSVWSTAIQNQTLHI